MKLPIPLCIALEKAIESMLSLDPETKARLQGIDGKVIAVNVTKPALTFNASIADGCVFIDTDNDTGDTRSRADTTVTGSLLALQSLSTNNDALYKGDVRIEGDIGTGHQLKEIVSKLDPNWQEAVAPFLGDGITHRIDMFQTQFLKWAQRTRDGTRSNTAEYLSEELDVIAPNACVHGFNDEVDHLRSDADRLSARIDKLERSKRSVQVDTE